jgi:hypothetical protein
MAGTERSGADSRKWKDCALWTVVDDSSTIEDSITIDRDAAPTVEREHRGLRMISARTIVELQDEATKRWHEAAPGPWIFEPLLKDPWLMAVSEQHRANFDLWHIEDEARTPGATNAILADVKHRIDRTNQARNDLAEELDRTLLAWLKARGLPSGNAPLHSESPGLMIDRLSILGLKIYHTREEAEREDGPLGHVDRNRIRLEVLLEQRGDLAGCLDALWNETLAGLRRFKLYKQLKMYNDPDLNPAIYGSAKSSSEA